MITFIIPKASLSFLTQIFFMDVFTSDSVIIDFTNGIISFIPTNFYPSKNILFLKLKSVIKETRFYLFM